MQNLYWRHLIRCSAALLAAVLAAPSPAAEIAKPNAFTLYAGRISAEETWHDVLLKPYSANYTDAFLVTAAYSRTYRESHEGALRSEFEGNITYNFGDQILLGSEFRSVDAALAALSLERAPGLLDRLWRRVLLHL